jgi:predicted lactoylglutathione lyase
MGTPVFMSPAESTVPARMTVATLGAHDVTKLRDFYAGLGWRLLVDSDDFVAFKTQGALLALFALRELEADARANANAPQHGFRGFTLAINVGSRAEVDSAIEAIRAHGGRITKEPVDAILFDGRSAYFADPEDNFWEVVYFGGGGDVGEAIRQIIGGT